MFKLREELTKKIDTDSLQKFCNRNDVLVLYIFGSQISDHYSKFSDLDLGVVFLDSMKDRIYSIDFYCDFKSGITKFFDFNEIDLLFMQKSSIKINFKIVCEGKALYSSCEEKRLNYEDMIICRGLDFIGELELYYRELEELIVEGDNCGR